MRCPLSSFSLFAVGVVCLCAFNRGAQAQSTAPVQAAVDESTGQVVFIENGQPVLQYNYQTVEPPEGYLDKIAAHNVKYARPRSNYIHPLYGLDGEKLTYDWSTDHPHHRGIYWAWPETGYGDQMGDLHALQRVFARPTGKLTIANDEAFAEIAAENLWKWDDEKPIVRELTTIRVYPTTDSGRRIDLTFEMTALEDGVTIARRGTNAYGGLNMRYGKTKDLKIGEHKDSALSNPQRAWTFISGSWEGTQQRSAVTAFEKTANPDYPGELVQYPNLDWFQPTFPAANTRYALSKDKPLTLRYRLWVHRDDATLNAHMSEFDAYQKGN